MEAPSHIHRGAIGVIANKNRIWWNRCMGWRVNPIGWNFRRRLFCKNCFENLTHFFAGRRELRSATSTLPCHWKECRCNHDLGGSFRPSSFPRGERGQHKAARQWLGSLPEQHQLEHARLMIQPRWTHHPKEARSWAWRFPFRRVQRNKLKNYVNILLALKVLSNFPTLLAWNYLGWNLIAIMECAENGKRSTFGLQVISNFLTVLRKSAIHRHHFPRRPRCRHSSPDESKMEPSDSLNLVRKVMTIWVRNNFSFFFLIEQRAEFIAVSERCR